MDQKFEQNIIIGSVPMGLPSASMPKDVNAEQPNVSGSRLHGRWLVLARVLWIAIFVSTLLYFCANLLVDNYDLVTTILLVAATSVWFAVSFVLFWRKSNDRVILLFSLVFMLVGGIFVPPHPVALFHGISWVWELSLDLIESLAQAALIVFYLFPDGRFVPRWTRWLALGWIALSLDQNVPGFINLGTFNLWNSPLFFLISKVVEVAFYCSLGFSLLYRYRRVSTRVQRQQTKWVVFAFTIVVLGVSAAHLELFVLPQYIPVLGLSDQLAQLVSSILFYFSPVLVPISIGIALLRYRLWDIDIIINRTLVYGVLTVSIVALYVLIVVGLGTVLQAQGNLGIALLATGMIAVLFQPLRSRLQRAVNRLMYGERDEPYAVLSRLGQRLEATLAPDAVLSTMVEMVAQALKLPYAAISLKQEQAFPIAASYGRAVDTSLVLSLVYQAETIGQLMLAPRSKGEPFTPADRRLLDDLARQASIAAHAVRLTADLQRSRERLVTTREEERRRLRRDLHDGLGPTLAALNLQAGVVRMLLKSDPAAADELVTEWRTELRAAIADIRRLVYELRPPALDELGLVGAIRERAAQYSTHAETNALQTMVEAPDSLPPLPAAVEVATYRIAQEALANIVHHAQARTCSIRLWVDDMLHLEITDNGIGLPAEHHAGVGLISMRERAAELGGTCIIEPVVTGGTRVCAQLPLPKE